VPLDKRVCRNRRAMRKARDVVKFDAVPITEFAQAQDYRLRGISRRRWHFMEDNPIGGILKCKKIGKSPSYVNTNHPRHLSPGAQRTILPRRRKKINRP
jgi:hypothetical protein